MQPISQPAVPSFPVTTPQTRTRRWPLLAGGGAALLLVVGLGAAIGSYETWRRGNQIAPGVEIEGVPVGGLSPAQAKARLQQKFGALQVQVKTPGHIYRRSLAQLGGQPQFSFAALHARETGREGGMVAGAWRYWTARPTARHLALPLRWDKTKLRRTLQEVAQNYARPAHDARLKVSPAGVTAVGGANGRALNVGLTLHLLQKKYRLGVMELPAATLSVKPRVTAADLQGRDVSLGTYSTTFNRGLAGRTRNVHIAADAIEGAVLMPGELFSFNAMTGERTWDKGYRMAHIFARQRGESEAQVIEGLAGGTCQVSSTLYNAVLRTNRHVSRSLRIVERNHHSLPVTYVPPGRDATVAWPYKDFKFRNSLDYPVYLRTSIAGSRLTISVWARVPHGKSLPAQAPQA